MNTKKLKLKPLTLLSTALALGIGASAPVYAQGESLEEITVTGSRIKRDDFEMATPTTVVDSEYMQNLGLINVSDALVQIPSNISVNTPLATSNGNFFAGSTIANLRGLNPFFGSRTLTMVDTRRFVPTNQGDGVDLNFIPSVMIQRMEVVTGGASAAYGSGAISGVTNIILNRSLEGGKLEADYGVTGEGDGDDYHVAGAYGTELMDGRAHVVIGGEYQTMDSIPCVTGREWCAAGYGTVTNSNYNTPTNVGNGAPNYVNALNVTRNEISNNGVFWGGSSATGVSLEADDAGTGTRAWTDGQYCDQFFAGSCIGGSGENIYRNTLIRGDVDRYSLFGNVSYEVSDSLSLFLEGSYGSVESFQKQNSLDSAFLQIRPDNGFIRAQVAAGNTALETARASHTGLLFPGSNAYFSKDWTSQFNTFNETTTDVWRIAFGGNGDIGATGWTWDAYFQYGETDRSQLVNDNRHLNASDFALDAVNSIVGDDSSPIVCRVTRDGFTASSAYANNPAALAANPNLALIAQGCVPVNPFGQTLTAEGKAYMVGFLREDLMYDQMVFAANTQGDIFEGFGAGPIKGALGLEYRLETGENLGAEELPAHTRNDFLIQYGESFAGDVDIIEGYGEIQIPLLANLFAVKYLEISGSVRQSHYTNDGTLGPGAGITREHDLTTWKVEGVWDVNDWLRVRGSNSLDIRAANFRELYYGQILHAGGIFGFCTNPFILNPSPQTDPCTWSLEGNPDVQPEEADTFTIGIVLKGDGAMEGVEFAMDYYNIEVSNSIQQASIARVWTGCFNGATDPANGNIPYCDYITFNPASIVNTRDPIDPDPLNAPNWTGGTGLLACNDVCGWDMVRTRALSFNAPTFKTSGVDFSLGYTKPIFDGTLMVRGLASLLIEQLTDFATGAPVEDVSGMTGPNNGFLADFASGPTWQGQVITSYAQGPWVVTMQTRMVSDGVLDHDKIGPDHPICANTATLNCLRIPESINDNTVPFYAIFNLNGSYRFENVFGTDRTVQLWGSINNLLDREPPLAPNGTGGTNPIFFDTMGRTFRVGLRAQF